MSRLNLIGRRRRLRTAGRRRSISSLFITAVEHPAEKTTMREAERAARRPRL